MNNLFTLEGRMRRKHYWSIWLLVFFINITCVFAARESSVFREGAVIISILAGVFLILQGVKRMHDTDHSGWFLLIPVYNLVLLLTPGTWGHNRYGADPKEHEQPNPETLKEVLDASEVSFDSQREGDNRRALIYLIVILGFGYFRNIIFQLIPMSYGGEDGSLLSYLNMTLAFELIEFVLYIYMMATVRNALAKTALVVFFILNVFYTMRFLLDQYLNSSLQF